MKRADDPAAVSKLALEDCACPRAPSIDTKMGQEVERRLDDEL